MCQSRQRRHPTLKKTRESLYDFRTADDQNLGHSRLPGNRNVQGQVIGVNGCAHRPIEDEDFFLSASRKFIGCHLEPISGSVRSRSSACSVEPSALIIADYGLKS